MARTARLWDAVVLHELVASLEDDGDALHVLWLLAVDEGLTAVRADLEQHGVIAVAHARRLGMVHSMWSVLRTLARESPMPRTKWNWRLGETTVDAVVAELERLGISTYVDRRHVLRTAVWAEWPPSRAGLHRASLTWTPVCEQCGRDRDTVDGCTEDPIKRHHCVPTNANPRGLHWDAHAKLQFVMYAAARRGLLESVVWVHEVARYDQGKALECAARHGHADVVEWLLDHPHDRIVVDWRRTDDENLGVMAWRTTTPGCSHYFTMSAAWGFQKSKTSYQVASGAAQRGDVVGVERLMRHALFGSDFVSEVVRSAIASGQFAVVDYLCDRYPYVLKSPSLLYVAVENGQWSIVPRLVTLGTSVISEWVMWKAVGDNHSAVLQCMLDAVGDRATFDTSILHVFASRRYLLDTPLGKQDLQLPSITFDKAYKFCGHTEIATWIVRRRMEAGTLSNEEVRVLFVAAIESNNVKLLRSFVDELNLWYPDAFRQASNRPSSEVLAFLYESTRARSEPLTVAHRWSGLICLDTLEWLLQHGFRSQFLGREALCVIQKYEREHASKQIRLGEYPSAINPMSARKMYRLREVMRLIIDVYDPVYLRQVTWLPKWAVRHGTLHSIERLAAIGHDGILTRRLLDGLLLRSSRENVVRWYLEQRPDFFTTLVVRWAVTHGKRGIFQWVFQTFLPRRADPCRYSELSTEILRHCVRTALWTASKFGHEDAARQLQQWTPVARDPSLWQGIGARFRVEDDTSPGLSPPQPKCQ